MSVRPAIASGPDFVPSPEQPVCLAQYIEALATSNPGGRLIDIDQFGRQRITTYGALFERANGIASRLRSIRSSASQIVLLCCEGATDYVAGAWASLFAGSDLMPCDTVARLTDPQHFCNKLARHIDSLGNACLLIDDAVFQTIDRCGMTAKLRPVRVAKNSISMSGGISRSHVVPPDVRQSRLLVQTSGTTADPKIAVLGSDSLINRFFDGWNPQESVQLHNMAHHTVAGIRLLLPVGRETVRLHPLRVAVRPKEWLDAIDHFAITDVGLSTSTAKAIFQALKSDASPVCLDSLRRISFGAEPIVPNIVREFLVALKTSGAGDAQISLVYSMTETGPLFRSILSMPNALSLLKADQPCLSLEQCVAGWRVRCVDDHGASVREGELGSIQVYSDRKMFSGYLNEPAPFVHDEAGHRWFDTGDLGSLNSSGLTLKGRNKSTIIVNARKITCEEIEAGLAACNSLAETMLVAAPYRTPSMATDEVAIFFVPRIRSTKAVVDLKRTIVREVSRRFGLSARKIIQINADDIDLTVTMKVRRMALMRKYMEGKLL